MDQLDGTSLPLHIVLHKFFGLSGPRSVQDDIHVQIDAGQNFIDLLDGVRFILRTLVRQSLCKIFGLITRRIVLKDGRQLVRKVFLVQIIIDVFTQEEF